MKPDPMSPERLAEIRRKEPWNPLLAEVDRLRAEREQLLIALRKTVFESGWCALCDGHHHEDDPFCPVMEPI